MIRPLLVLALRDLAAENPDEAAELWGILRGVRTELERVLDNLKQVPADLPVILAIGGVQKALDLLSGTTEDDHR